MTMMRTNMSIITVMRMMVENTAGGWLEFDYVPEECQIRSGSPDVTGKFCVIGSGLNEDNLEKLFRRKMV